MSILIKNGLVYKDKEFKKLDVLIEGNKIKKIGKNLKETAKKIIDAQELHVFPGFIDTHVHLRDPGQTHKEDIVSGTKAAAKGGFTTVCAMPNTEPVVDNIASVEYIKRKANDLGFCKVEVIGALTKKSEGKEITEVKSMVESGIIGVSDDGRCVQNSKLMLNAMKYTSFYNIPVIIHAEDYYLAGNGQINAGKMSSKLGLGGIPGLAEEIIVSRDIMLAESAKCHLHVAHISTRKSIEFVRHAKANGLKITAEVTPHHLILTEEEVINFDTNTKVKPPLRAEVDRQACVDGLLDGTIDFIATDHAPHADYEKEVEYTHAPYGINGLETAFASLYTELVMNNVLSLEFLIEKMTIAPAGFIKKETGVIEEGKFADITIVDLNADINFDADNFVSKSKNSPYLGKTLKGKVMKTICNGKITWEIE